MALKHYFMDSLINIAIIISLLGPDYFGSNINDYPEVQEIMSGQTSVYTQTQFHHNQWLNSYDGPHGTGSIKNIHSYNTNLIFNDINALSSHHILSQQQFHTNAWMLAAGQNSSLDHDLEPLSGDHHSSGMDHHLISESDLQNSDSLTEETTRDNENNLSDEDADLIEVLWRQDMDMGMGREVFDSELRLQREKDEAKKKELQKVKDMELKNESLESEKEAFPTTDLTSELNNYVIDGETGEWISTAPNNNQSVNNETLHPPVKPLDLEGTLLLLQEDNAEPESELPILDEELQSILDSVVEDNAVDDNVEQQHSPSLNCKDSFENIVPFEDLSGSSDNLEMLSKIVLPTNVDNNSSSFLTDTLNHMTHDMANISMLSDNTTATTAGLLSNATMPVVNNEQSYQDMLELLPVNNSESLNNTLSDLLTSINHPNQITQENSTPNTGLSVTELLTPEALQNLTNGYGSFTGELNITNAMNPSSILNDLLDGSQTSDFSQQSKSSCNFLNNTPVVDVIDNFSNSSSGYQGSNLMDDYASDYSGTSNPAYTPSQEFSDGLSDGGVFDGTEGATGGAFEAQHKVKTKTQHISESGNDGRPFGNWYGTETNITQSFRHNHTYSQQMGLPLRETRYPTYKKQREESDFLSRKTITKDEKRAKALKLPLTMSEIIDSSCDKFAELIQYTQLTPSQDQLVRDIRRRGKNKVAAQNCRKRKLDVVLTLEDEVNELRQKHVTLSQERQHLISERNVVKNKLELLQVSMLSTLRDENNLPYDPAIFTVTIIDGQLTVIPIRHVDSRPDRSRQRRRGSRRYKKE